MKGGQGSEFDVTPCHLLHFIATFSCVILSPPKLFGIALTGDIDNDHGDGPLGGTSGFKNWMTSKLI